jgi:hypothetical protein
MTKPPKLNKTPVHNPRILNQSMHVNSHLTPSHHSNLAHRALSHARLNPVQTSCTFQAPSHNLAPSRSVSPTTTTMRLQANSSQRFYQDKERLLKD